MPNEIEDADDVDIPDSWSLHPFVIRHAPTEEEKRRSPALQGVDDLLYGGGPLNLQSTYRTQGNNAMEQAKGSQTKEEREKHLELAVRLYDGALDIEIQLEGQQGQEEKEADAGVITEKELRTRRAILMANKAEALRQLGRLQEAYRLATLAINEDNEYYKGYLRRARICESISDYARAVMNYKKAYDRSFKDDVRKLLNKARKTLKAMEQEYSRIVSFYVTLNPTLADHIGLALPIVELSNTLESVMKYATTLHIVYPQFSLIERITDFNYETPLQAYIQLLFQEPRGDEAFDKDYSLESVSLYFAPDWCDLLDSSGHISSYATLQVRFQRVDPNASFLSLVHMGCTIPLVPTLFVVNKETEDEFLLGYSMLQ
ncbi:hypothetical protein GMRT_15614 [Giardia muris]|uniref:Uncharacterized protein n=1 Tax=Giardia muris TaxID=5742 RepID=A0A4Z1SV35_GIAMU|nr:hypothetical protein GMRT_15614 [Giardia muris]|eukprot:TNJ28795.1 hypothetical protein GMRT_15614 [Giardia muris]